MVRKHNGSGRCSHTKPDPDQDGAWLWSIIPAPPPRQPGGGLHQRFGDRWDIAQQDTGTWSAEHRDGTRIHYLVAHSPAELAGKLAAAGYDEGRRC